MKTYQVEDLQKLLPEPGIALRKPDQKLIDQYAESMANGSIFPPITLGTSDGKTLVVDGVHRVLAAAQAKIKSLNAEDVLYKHVDDLLYDMYQRNLHGKTVRPGERDERIKLLREAHKWTQEKIAKMFALDQSTVSRILKGEVSETGHKGKGKKKKEFKPLSGKSFLTTTEKMVRSLKRTATIQDLVELCWVSEDGISQKEHRECAANLDTLKELKDGLVAFFNHLDSEIKKKG